MLNGWYICELRTPVPVHGRCCTVLSAGNSCVKCVGDPPISHGPCLAALSFGASTGAYPYFGPSSAASAEGAALFARLRLQSMKPAPAMRNAPATAPTATPAVAPVDSPDDGSFVDEAVAAPSLVVSLASLEVFVLGFGLFVRVPVGAEVVADEGSVMLNVWLEKRAPVSPVLKSQRLNEFPSAGSMP